MRYHYLAANMEGAIEKGEIEAVSEVEAAEQLRRRGLFPLEITKPHRLKFSFSLSSGLKVQDLLFFTEQLARLLRAGVSLDKALKILTQVFAATNRETLQSLLLKLMERVEGGQRLSEAIADTGFFPEFYLNLIKAGEISGSLEDVLESIAVYLKEKQNFQQELLSALLYPSFLMIFGLLAVQTILVYVLPRFGSIFEEMGVEPPTLTRFLISLGVFWKQWGWIFLIGLLGGLVFLRVKLLAPENRRWLEEFLFRVPFLGRLLILIDLARVFRGLYVMLKGGVNIEQALALSSNIPGSLVLRDFFAHLAEEIKEGVRLSVLFADLPNRFIFVRDLLAIGEETGRLEDSFYDLTVICEDEVRLRLKRFLNILEPATILFFGLTLGIIIISILVAIFDLRLS